MLQLTGQPDNNDNNYTYTAALQEIQKSYSGMDSRFNEIFLKTVTRSFVDVYPAPENGKQPGGYCYGLFALKAPALIFMNYNGIISDQKTLTHELGHGINFYLMGNSVEGRFPFLDTAVMDLANSFPSRHKLLALDEKHILKREFADLVPESILRRPKQPYRAPDAASFFDGGGPEWMEDVVSERAVRDAGVFEYPAVASLFAKCSAVEGRRMSNTDNMRVLAILSTQLAHRHFIEGDGSGGRDRAPPEPITAMDMLTK